MNMVKERRCLLHDHRRLLIAKKPNTPQWNNIIPYDAPDLTLQMYFV